MLEIPVRFYRIRFLIGLAPVLGPPLLTRLVLKTTGASDLIPSALRAVLYVGSTFLVVLLRDWVSYWRQVREAKRYGARLAPRLRGSWPGNLDRLLYFIRVGLPGYVGYPIKKMLEEYNCNILNARFLFEDFLITADEGHIKHILATGFNDFDKGVSQKVILDGFLGDGIFNSDGARWKMHRAMTRPFFARERVTDFEIFGRHADDTLRVLEARTMAPTGAVDVQDLFGRFTLDTGAEFLFGASLDTLHAKLPVPGKAKLGLKGAVTEDEFGSFANAFERAQIIIQERFTMAAFWPLLEMFQDKNTGPRKVIREFLQPIVQQAVERHQRAKTSGLELEAEETTLLDYLVANTDNQNLIRDELLNIMLAGRDTTASTLTFVVYFLALHPDVCIKLRAEILQTVGPSAMPTFDNLRDMKYMRAVLNETLRIFPPVPLNQRCTGPNGTVIPSSNPAEPPLYVPPYTDFGYATILMQRRKDLWGPDAEDFDPERWIDETRLQRYLANPMIFVPFNAGPRICLGQQFAYNEMGFFLVRLLQKFSSVELTPEYQPEGSLPPEDWKNEDGRQAWERIWPRAALTLFVKGGLWARFKLAKDA